MTMSMIMSDDSSDDNDDTRSRVVPSKESVDLSITNPETGHARPKVLCSLRRNEIWYLGWDVCIVKISHFFRCGVTWVTWKDKMILTGFC